MEKRKVPDFKRQNWDKKRVGLGWRRARGIDSKQRIRRNGFGATPSIGYSQAAADRGVHPSGKTRVRICNEKELSLVPKDGVAMIAATVGGRKRATIVEAAKKKGIKIAF